MQKDNNNYIYWFAILFLIPHMLIAVIIWTILFVKKYRQALPWLIFAFVIMAIFIFIYPDYLSIPFNEFGNVLSLAIKTMDSKIILFSFTKYSIIGHLFMMSLSIIVAYIAYRIINIDNKGMFKTYSQTFSGDNAMKSKNKNTDNIKIDLHSTVIGSKGRNLITVSDNAKHVFVAGTTGSGKTVLLSNFIEHGINMDYPMLIIDGKGDTGKGSIYDVLQKIKGDRKLYVIDMNNIAMSSRYNPFKDSNPTVVKDMLINLTEWSEEHYKTNAERYIQRVLFTMYKMSIPFSFSSIIHYLQEEEFSLLSAEGVNQGIITKEEQQLTATIMITSSDIAQKATARFITMAESELGEIFAEDGTNIYEAIKENAIILFVLDPLSYPELSPLMGRLILTDAKKCINQLFKEKKERVFFIFDEINVYASPLLINLISKARSANTTCILATQSLADLKYASGEAFEEQVIENCNNYIVLRQNSANSAEKWAKIFGTRQTMEMTYQIGEQNSRVTATGKGSARQVREFLYHPDEIKNLKTGKGIYMSKDEGKNSKVDVKKGNFI